MSKQTTIHLKKGITDLENTVLLKLIKMTIEHDNTTTETLLSLRANFSSTQLALIGYSARCFQTFIAKHPDIFTITQQTVKIRPEIYPRLNFFTKTTLQNAICTVERAGNGFGFLLTEHGETVYFGANTFQDGRTQDLSTRLKPGDKVVVTAITAKKRYNAHWNAAKVKKLTDINNDVINFTKKTKKNEIEARLYRVQGTVIDKYCLALQNKTMITIPDSILSEYSSGDSVLCNAVKESDGFWTATNIQVMLSKKKSNFQAVNGSVVSIKGYIGAIDSLYPSFGFVKYGSDDFIYFNKDSVGKTCLTDAMRVGDKVICDADLVYGFPCKYVAKSVKIHKKSNEFSWNSDVLVTNKPQKLFSCAGPVVRVYRNNVFVQHKDGEFVFVSKTVFFNQTKWQVEQMDGYLKPGDVVCYDADEGNGSEACRWRATVAWTRPEKFGNAESSIQTEGSVLSVSSDEGLISIGLKSFHERVFFTVDKYFHNGDHVTDLTTVLEVKSKVHFEAEVCRGEATATKWVARCVWTGSKPTVTWGSVVDSSCIQNGEGIVHKIKLKDGVLRFGKGEVCFGVDDFFQDGEQVQRLDWSVKLGERVFFDAVDVGSDEKRKWKAVLVWKGTKPKKSVVDKKRKVEEELMKSCPLVGVGVVDSEVPVVTIPSNIVKDDDESAGVGVEGNLAKRSKLSDGDECSEQGKKKRTRKRAKKNKKVEMSTESKSDVIGIDEGHIFKNIGTVADCLMEDQVPTLIEDISTEDSSIEDLSATNFPGSKVVEHLTEIETEDILLNHIGCVDCILEEEKVGYLRVDKYGYPLLVRFNLADLFVSDKLLSLDDVHVGDQYYFDAQNYNGEWLAFQLWSANSDDSTGKVVESPDKDVSVRGSLFHNAILDIQDSKTEDVVVENNENIETSKEDEVEESKAMIKKRKKRRRYKQGKLLKAQNIAEELQVEETKESEDDSEIEFVNNIVNDVPEVSEKEQCKESKDVSTIVFVDNNVDDVPEVSEKQQCKESKDDSTIVFVDNIVDDVPEVSEKQLQECIDAIIDEIEPEIELEVTDKKEIEENQLQECIHAIIDATELKIESEVTDNKEIEEKQWEILISDQELPIDEKIYEVVEVPASSERKLDLEQINSCERVEVPEETESNCDILNCDKTDNFRGLVLVPYPIPADILVEERFTLLEFILGIRDPWALYRDVKCVLGYQLRQLGLYIFKKLFIFTSNVIAYLSKTDTYQPQSINYRYHCLRRIPKNTSASTTFADVSTQTVFTGEISGSNIYHDVD